MIMGVLTSLTNPVWANAEHTQIDCVITISQFGDEQLPFTADQNDVAEHGRKIFAKVAAGEYGPIAEFVPPPINPDETPAMNAAGTESETSSMADFISSTQNGGS